MVRRQQAPVPDDPAPQVDYQLVSHRRLVRRRRGASFAVLAILTPVALTLLVGAAVQDSIEETVSQKAASALTEGRVNGVNLVMDGRVVTAEVPTGQSPEIVEKLLVGVPGVAAVKIKKVFASEAEAAACADIQGKLDAATGGQRIQFAGSSTTPTAAGNAALKSVAKVLKRCRAVSVVVGGHADSRTPNGPNISFNRAKNMVGTLKSLGVEEERMSPRGYADQFPLRQGDGAAARAANQRGSVVATDG